jgi:hypothetical protein
MMPGHAFTRGMTCISGFCLSRAVDQVPLKNSNLV